MTCYIFLCKDTATTEIHTLWLSLSRHDSLPLASAILPKFVRKRLRAIREFAMARRILVHVAVANAWPCHPRALALVPAEAACCVRPSCRAPSLGPATEMVFCRPDLQGPND